jgi:hypothetical protein
MWRAALIRAAVPSMLAGDTKCPKVLPPVNTSGKAGAQIPQFPLEMIHPSGGDNAVCMQPYTAYTAECKKSLTATYQCKTKIPSNKLLANTILNNS